MNFISSYSVCIAICLHCNFVKNDPEMLTWNILAHYQALMGKHSLPSPTSSGLIWGDVRGIIELLSHFLDDSQKLDFNWMRLSRYDKTHSTEIFPLSEGRPGVDGGGGQRGQRGGRRSDQPGRSGGTGGTPTLDGSDGRTYGTGHCQATLSLA